MYFLVVFGFFFMVWTSPLSSSERKHEFCSTETIVRKPFPLSTVLLQKSRSVKNRNSKHRAPMWLPSNYTDFISPKSSPPLVWRHTVVLVIKGRVTPSPALPQLNPTAIWENYCAPYLRSTTQQAGDARAWTEHCNQSKLRTERYF